MAQDLSFAGATDGKVVNLAENTWADAIKLLPLGDSLTFGVSFNPSSTTVGYRGPLFQHFTSNGLLADFVGDRQNGTRVSGDLDHGGVSGRTADQLLADIPNYINTYHPDVILLMIGTNDVLQADAINTVPGEIRAVIDAIHALSPNTKIFLSELPPRWDDTVFGPELATNTDAINAQLPDLVADALADGIDITFVPLPTLGDNDLTDGTHLTRQGYAEIAQAWVDAMLAHLPHDNGTFGGTTHAVDADTVNVQGGEGNDLIIGDSGANILRGNGGNDQLQGGIGADTLTGNAGVDWFIYTNTNQGGDIITDFDSENDMLVFSIDQFNGAGIVPGHNAPFTLSDSGPVGTNAQFIYNPNNGQFFWDPDGTGAAATVLIATLQTGPTIGTDDIMILGPFSNATPIITPFSDQVGQVGQAFSFQLPASSINDADGDALSIFYQNASGGALPSWLTVNYGTRTISGTPTQAGTYTVRITVTDAYGGLTYDDFNIVVGGSNTPPAVANPIPDRPATEDVAFSFQFASNTFSDANGDTLTYSASLPGGAALPSWLTFNATTRTFSGTPAQGDTGSLTVIVTANDGHGATASDAFVINIAEVNEAPTVANPIADKSAPEDSAFSFTVPANAFADEEDTLTYSATLSSGAALPAWLSFNATTRTFTGTPDQVNVGSITVRVTVNDGHGHTTFDDFVIATAAVNDWPLVANAIADVAINEDTAISHTIPANTFSDQENDTLTWSAALSNGSALPAWLSFNTTTHQFTGTPPANFNGAYTVRVTVNDGHGGTAFDDFVLTVNPVNDAPTVANAIPDRPATEDSAFSFTFAANAFADVDGDTLTYSATLSSGAALPSWLSFNAATRTFSGTPLNANVGAITVRVTADDGHGGTRTDDFVITVANTNDAPTVANAIADQSAAEDSAFSFTFAVNTFADVDVGDTLSYSASLSSGSSLPAWLSFNATTRTFSGMPANGDVGTFTVRVTANDGNGGTTFDDFTFTVTNTNDAPTVANAIPNQNATEDSAFSFQFASNAFADVDVGDTLAYSATLVGGGALPAWLTFNATTRTFSGTPANGDVGSINVRITANDGHGGTITDDFTITIANTNDAPTVANAIPNQNATEDSAFSFQFASNAFADVDVGDTLAYSATLMGGGALPAWLSFNATTRTFSGTPANDDVGSINVRVTANDGHGGTITDDFTIIIANTNDAPTVANAIADQPATEDVEFSFSFDDNVFADVDVGDTLTYSATLSSGAALPAWLSFDADARIFSGTPAQSDVGSITVRVTANDGHGGTVFEDFVITTEAVNDAPVVASPIADQAASEDFAFSFTLPAGTFTDVDDASLNLIAVLPNGQPLPSWLHFDANTGAFSGTPAQGDVGTITVRVSADDGHGLSVFDDFDIVIAPTNDAPAVNAPIANQTAFEDSAFSYTVPLNTFTDEEFDTLSFTATLSNGSALPAWLSFNPTTRTFSGTPVNADVGPITVRVTANDGNGGVTSDDFVLTVTNTNDAPTVSTPIADKAATEGALFTFALPAGTFADVDVGDTLAYSATLSNGAALPSWLSFDVNTRTFSGTPDNTNIGTITVRVTVNDGHGGVISDDFTITTANVVGDPTPMNGTTGDDNMSDGLGDDLILAGNGADTINKLFRGDADIIDGGAGVDKAVAQGLASGAQSYVIGTVSSGGSTYVKVDALSTGGVDLRTIAVEEIDLTTGSGVDTITIAGDLGAGGVASSTIILHTGGGNDSVDGSALAGDPPVRLEVFGEAGNDSITGGGAADLLDGGIGNDTLDGRGGIDEMVGGAGNDTYIVDNEDDVVTESLNDGTDLVRASTDYALTDNVENLALQGAVGLTGEGNTLDNRISGTAQADLIIGHMGADTLIGGAGNDVIHGDTPSPDGDVSIGGADDIDGGAGNDFIFGGAGDDVLKGGAGNDQIFNVAGEVNEFGLPGWASGFGGADTIDGGAGVDRATLALGDGGAITFDANRPTTAATTIYVNGVASGSVVNVESFYVSAGNLSDNLRGGAGGDTLIGLGGDDFLYGQSGNDALHGDDGADTMSGGAGNDLLMGGDGADTINGDSGNDDLWGGAGGDGLNGGIGDDTLMGEDGDDVLFGLDGADKLFGGAGADILSGGKGDDVLKGDAGDDSLLGDDGDDTLYGGDGLDTLKGDLGADKIYGEAGDDQIWGGDGNDWFNGGAGNDTIRGEAGDDEIYGLDGNDILTGGDGVDLLNGGVGDDQLTGGAGADTLSGADGADKLFGGLDNDWLSGGNGVDNILGEDGDDTMFGGADNDTLKGGAGIDTINGDAGDDDAWGGDGGDMMRGGDGADKLRGEAGDDFLFGGAGNDVLTGGDGIDTLRGERGNDQLYGGAGDDQFAFYAADLANGEADKIFDFGDVAGNQDVLHFYGVNQGAVSIADGAGGATLTVDLGGGQSWSVFITGATAAGLSDDLLFN